MDNDPGSTAHGNVETRSQLLSLPAHGLEGRPGDGGLRRRVRSQPKDARRDRRRRRRSQVKILLQDHQHDADAQRR